MEVSAKDNYLNPADYAVTSGVIWEETTIEALQTPENGCEGAYLELPYTIQTGEPAAYQVLFDANARAAGFSNIAYTSTPASEGSGTLSIPVPEGLKEGTYSAQVQFVDPYGNESELYSFSFTINLSSTLVVSKFDDVVLLNNSDNRFTSYQWYKNDQLIAGATEQFYCDPQGLSGSYYVVTTTTDGATLRTCPVTFYANASSRKAGVKVYPNPAVSGLPFGVEITGVNEQNLSDAVLRIFSNQGILMYETSEVKSHNQVTLNVGTYGVYLIRIISPTGVDLSDKVTISR